MNVVKKPFLFVLVLALLLFAGPLYAAQNPTEMLVVETDVLSVHGLKLVAHTAINPTTVANFNNLAADTGNFSVTAENYGSTQTVRKLVTYCNSVAGYDVLLSASAMTSTQSSNVIRYTVTAGGATVTTAANGAETAAANKVVAKTSLSAIDFYNAPIKITVNASDYLGAVAASYLGTIKITLVSN